jgi:glycosyltransferase involved in cell wall biosynthesis
MTIYINIYHSNSGGAINVALRFLETARDVSLDCCLLVKRDSHYVSWAVQNGLLYEEFPDSLLGLFRLYSTGFLKKFRGDLLNFGDIPLIWLTGKNYYYFDWPYLLTEEAEVWSRMSFRERVYRNIKRFAIKTFIRSTDVFIVQTDGIKERLRVNYSGFTYKVVPNTTKISPILLPKVHDKEFVLGCLSRYYTHKNIEILIDVVSELKNRGFSVKILLTLNIEDHENVSKLLKEIEIKGFQDSFENIGTIPNTDVLNFYNRCDAIILPSLIETFSGLYVESMVLGKPLLLSDRWFARDVCESYANYFDPLDPKSIAQSIITLKSEINTEEHFDRIYQGREFALKSYCKAETSLLHQILEPSSY